MSNSHTYLMRLLCSLCNVHNGGYSTAFVGGADCLPSGFGYPFTCFFVVARLSFWQVGPVIEQPGMGRNRVCRSQFLVDGFERCQVRCIHGPGCVRVAAMAMQLPPEPSPQDVCGRMLPQNFGPLGQKLESMFSGFGRELGNDSN